MENIKSNTLSSHKFYYFSIRKLFVTSTKYINKFSDRDDKIIFICLLTSSMSLICFKKIKRKKLN